MARGRSKPFEGCKHTVPVVAVKRGDFTRRELLLTERCGLIHLTKQGEWTMSSSCPKPTAYRALLAPQAM